MMQWESIERIFGYGRMVMSEVSQLIHAYRANLICNQEKIV